ncbi:hypothetical protein [Stieleria varia]|uniref:Nucleotidyltransferase family protein n=1 Tax=Stieleria varia TaxID=2528005 RepID=A0A5C6ANY1_9BACT|nr:hypothetical protein [Stieleria varia]TWU00816.1 hypothetical protein Pla52n_41850 [Stieleria varia]
MSNDFFRAVDLLLARNVPLTIIGGHAVVAHGHIRATQDIDVLFLRSPEVEQQVAEVLREINAFWISDDVDPETGIEKTVPADIAYVRSSHLMMLGSDCGFLDLFDFVPGLADTDVSTVLADSITISGRPFASLAWLRRMKQASGRPIDLSDLQALPE